MSTATQLDVGLIGFGEVGKIFAAGLQAVGVGQVAVWDLKFADPVTAESERVAASRTWPALL